MLGLALYASVVTGQAQIRDEYALKALFFVTLARYTEWPTNAFTSPTAPLVIGVIGEDPFGQKLPPLVRNEKVQQHPLEVRYCGGVDEARECHMLYFGPMSPTLLGLSLSQLKGRPILTVSDRRNFISEGGMVELFVNDENRVRLRVSRRALERASLDFSPTLWKLADKVAVYEIFPFSSVQTDERTVSFSDVRLAWLAPDEPKSLCR